MDIEGCVTLGDVSERHPRVSSDEILDTLYTDGWQLTDELGTWWIIPVDLELKTLWLKVNAIQGLIWDTAVSGDDFLQTHADNKLRRFQYV